MAGQVMFFVTGERSEDIRARYSASTMASCTCGLIILMACELRSGQVRLVSSVTLSWRSGSIHKDVPVKPRCPKERGDKCAPDDEGLDGVSQPNAREVPTGEAARRVKSSTVAGLSAVSYTHLTLPTKRIVYI